MGEGLKRAKVAVRKFHVGQRVWEFDENRRVYQRDENGRSLGGPIYSEHFRERLIDAIDGRFYRVSYGPKSDGRLGETIGFQKAERMLLSDDDKAARIWDQAHRYRIVEMVQRCPVGVLIGVARMVGFDADGGGA